jgi:hypothetical protein
MIVNGCAFPPFMIVLWVYFPRLWLYYDCIMIVSCLRSIHSASERLQPRKCETFKKRCFLACDYFFQRKTNQCFSGHIHQQFINLITVYSCFPMFYYCIVLVYYCRAKVRDIRSEGLGVNNVSRPRGFNTKRARHSKKKVFGVTSIQENWFLFLFECITNLEIQ